jgi:hypothetical protein
MMYNIVGQAQNEFVAGHTKWTINALGELRVDIFKYEAECRGCCARPRASFAGILREVAEEHSTQLDKRVDRRTPSTLM